LITRINSQLTPRYERSWVNGPRVKLARIIEMLIATAYRSADRI
jgi:hypothetical protein